MPAGPWTSDLPSCDNPLITPPPRTARLVLITRDGGLVGSLPAVAVSTPWWQDVEPVVQAIRDRDGVDVTILRMLEAELDEPPGGDVTYLAEVAHRVPAEPWHGTLDDHPLRHSFARPGGPAADLAWAKSVLLERALHPTGRPVQVRTWNLSSVWRIPVEGQTTWLKVVPAFFAHEGPLLARLAGPHIPRLLGQDCCRILLAEIVGEDQHQAELPLLLAMVTLLVDLQAAWASRVGELLALGLPDWRASALTALVADVIERTADELSAEDNATLGEFACALPERFTEVAACGLVDTLVHGDFWPGNVRGEGGELTLFDWGDSGAGHPLLDQSAFLERIPSGSRNAVVQHWVQQWLKAVPGSDPVRAMRLLGPVGMARLAVVYRQFLDRIEPAEHPYHRTDPAGVLHRTAILLRESRANA